MNIGKAIKKIRTEKSLSQKDLSERTTISRTSLSQIEKGKKRPSVKNLKKICSILEVPDTLVYFYGLEESDIPKKNKKLYDLIYPSLENMIRKLMVVENN